MILNSSIEYGNRIRRRAPVQHRVAVRADRLEIVHRIDDIRFYAQCFDRPAFQDHFHQEGSMEAFDKAIEDTITALNTGCLRSRDGGILAQGIGKAYLRKVEWRSQMNTVGDLLRAIRSRYDGARKEGSIHVNGDFYCIQDSELARWMDETRSQILTIFSDVCSQAGVVAPLLLKHAEDTAVSDHPHCFVQEEIPVRRP